MTRAAEKTHRKAWRIAKRTILFDLIVLAAGIALAQGSGYASNLTSKTLNWWRAILAHVGNGGLAWSLAAIGIVTFVQSMRIAYQLGAEDGPKASTRESRTRWAMTVTFSTVYFVLLGTFTFFRFRGDVPPLGTQLIASFTSLMAVIVAFYFGSSAYVEAKRGQDEASNGEVGKQHGERSSERWPPPRDRPTVRRKRRWRRRRGM